MHAPALLTAEQFAAMPNDGPSELVRGVVVPLNPPGGQHGEIAVLIGAALLAVARPKGSGHVFVESGCITERDPDSVRGPDVSFVRKARFEGRPPRGYISGAPDLAVEIRSPDDTLASLFAKAAEYEAAGAEIVWIVNPIKSKVYVLSKGKPRLNLGIGDTLDGGDVLPGFALPVAELFPHPV